MFNNIEKMIISDLIESEIEEYINSGYDKTDEYSKILKEILKKLEEVK